MGFWDSSGISWTICKQSAPRSRHITNTNTRHSIFTDRTLFLMPNQQCHSTEGIVSPSDTLYCINQDSEQAWQTGAVASADAVWMRVASSGRVNRTKQVKPALDGILGLQLKDQYRRRCDQRYHVTVRYDTHNTAWCTTRECSVR